MEKLMISLSVLLFFITGCSEVSFSPSDKTERLGLRNPDGSNLVTETFFQDGSQRKVDVMIVMDNSLSMLEEQQKVGERFNSFLDSLRDLDWQVGITTTDVSSGSFGLKGELLNFEGTNSHILTAQVPDYETKFLNTVVRQETIECNNSSNPICPSGVEQPLAATMLAISKRDRENDGFFRKDADLAVIMVSDEDEMSDGPPEATAAEEVIDYVRSVFLGRKRLTTYGIIVEPGDQACLEQQTVSGGHYGKSVAQLSAITGGVTGSICAPDYASNLRSIGERVFEVSQSIELSAPPVAGSVTVELTPYHPDVRWRVEGKKILFTIAPEKGTRIDVRYERAK